MKRKLRSTPRFEREARRLAKRNARASEAVRATLAEMAADAFSPALGAHKLHGDLAGLWACSAGYDLRIVFQLASDTGAETIVLHGVGSHDDVY